MGNCMRAGVLNGTRMAVYESSKELMEETFRWSRADPKNQVSSAGVSSFFITCLQHHLIWSGPTSCPSQSANAYIADLLIVLFSYSGRMASSLSGVGSAPFGPDRRQRRHSRSLHLSPCLSHAVMILYRLL